ncbi:MAG: hypothetical protein H6729_05575 [Deltaproteobacteria bacterium]|nr:hypothetical protein [Deltaproteobacteria bacterium]
MSSSEVDARAIEACARQVLADGVRQVLANGVRQVLADGVRQVLADGAHEVPADDARTRRVVLSLRTERWVVADETLGVVVKAYRRDVGVWAWTRDRLLGRRAVRVARASERARRRGLPVPRVLAVVEDRTGSALAFSLISSGRGLREHAASLTRIPLRQQRTVEVASLLRRIHRSRIYPSDFHAGNVLVDAQGELHLVDPDGLRAVLWVSHRRRVRNIERLLRDFWDSPTASRSARLRFLLAYAGERRSSRRRSCPRRGAQHRACRGWGGLSVHRSVSRSVRRLWRCIDVLSRRKRAQYAQTSQPLGPNAPIL